MSEEISSLAEKELGKYFRSMILEVDFEQYRYLERYIVLVSFYMNLKARYWHIRKFNDAPINKIICDRITQNIYNILNKIRNDYGQDIINIISILITQYIFCEVCCVKLAKMDCRSCNSLGFCSESCKSLENIKHPIRFFARFSNVEIKPDFKILDAYDNDNHRIAKLLLELEDAGEFVKRMNISQLSFSLYKTLTEHSFLLMHLINSIKEHDHEKDIKKMINDAKKINICSYCQLNVAYKGELCEKCQDF